MERLGLDDLKKPGKTCVFYAVVDLLLVPGNSPTETLGARTCARRFTKEQTANMVYPESSIKYQLCLHIIYNSRCTKL